MVNSTSDNSNQIGSAVIGLLLQPPPELRPTLSCSPSIHQLHLLSKLSISMG